MNTPSINTPSIMLTIINHDTNNQLFLAIHDILLLMALMSLRSRSHVKASMVLTRAEYLIIHTYIRSLLNNILRPIL